MALPCLYPCVFLPEQKKWLSHGAWRALTAGGSEITTVPCGHCTNCLVNKSQEWAVRCVLEAEQYAHNYFVTLTFDDAHLADEPHPLTVSQKTGEIISVPSLRNDAISRFMKALRQKVFSSFDHDGIKFFGCGEYGELHGRPHYHVLLFNMPDLSNELEFYRRSGGNIYYTSPFFSSVWPFGFVVISEVNYNTAAYVARYTLKKQYGVDKRTISKVCAAAGVPGTLPPYIRMSRRPGIAHDVDLAHIYETDKVVVSSPNGAKIIKPPRYFDSLMDEIDHGVIESVKSKRVERGKAFNALLDNTDIPIFQRLERAKHQAEDRKKKLSRSRSEI